MIEKKGVLEVIPVSVSVVLIVQSAVEVTTLLMTVSVNPAVRTVLKYCFATEGMEPATARQDGLVLDV